MTKRYVVVGADRSGSSWHILETDDRREAFRVNEVAPHAMGVFDNENDGRQVSEEDDDLCVRWGTGPDGCVRPFDHLGQCQDAAGNTTMSIAAQYLVNSERESR